MALSTLDCNVGQQVYRGSHQTKGIAMVPKRVLDIMSCEIVRLLQLTESAVVPISYHVQRKVSWNFAFDSYYSPEVFNEPYTHEPELQEHLTMPIDKMVYELLKVTSLD